MLSQLKPVFVLGYQVTRIYDWKKSLKSIWRKHSAQMTQDDKSILNWETE